MPSVGDSFDPRHSGDLALYSKWKKIEENIALESSIKSVLIGRLFSASGRFMTKPKSYALGGLHNLWNSWGNYFC